MLENVNVLIVIYVLALIIQGFVSNARKSWWGTIPLCITAILFVIFRQKNVFYLLCFQTIVFGISRLTHFVVITLILKSKQDKFKKTKIQDL